MVIFKFLLPSNSSYGCQINLWMAVVFGINSSRIVKQEENSAQLHLALFHSFLFTMFALLIPNTTAIRPITCSNTIIIYRGLGSMMIFTIGVALS